MNATPSNATPDAAGLQRKNSVIGKPFPKGRSGNPSGRRPGSVSLRAAMKRAATREAVDAIAQKVLALAQTGDLGAVKIVADLLGEPGLRVREDASTVEKIRALSAAALRSEISVDVASALARVLSIESSLVDVAALVQRLEFLESKEKKS